MGWNTTIMIQNDALGMIAADPQFGAKLSQAIASWEPGETVRIDVQGWKSLYVGAAMVIESHHSSDEVLVKVGGNRGVVVQVL